MRIGLDVGSTTLKCVVLDEEDQIVYSDYQRHFSQITGKTVGMLEDIIKQFPEEKALSDSCSMKSASHSIHSMDLAMPESANPIRLQISGRISLRR